MARTNWFKDWWSGRTPEKKKEAMTPTVPRKTLPPAVSVQLQFRAVDGEYLVTVESVLKLLKDMETIYPTGWLTDTNHVLKDMQRCVNELQFQFSANLLKYQHEREKLSGETDQTC